DDVAVDRTEAHLAVTQPRQHRPALGDLQVTLRELVEVADAVGLVAAQVAAHAQLAADEVLEAAALLVLAIEVGARSHLEHAPGDLADVGPAQVGALVAAVQVDDATGVRGAALGAAGN